MAEKMLIPIEKIYPNDLQPRRNFDDESLRSLSQSIKIHGIIQPLAVHENSDRFMIIAGERRYRASLMAGLTKLPCIVMGKKTPKGVMEMALVENIQRENLNPVEEALAYKSLRETYNMTQEQIASAMGKSRPYITNAIRLLNLPEPVIEFLRNGEILAGHGKAILKLESRDAQMEIAKRAAMEKLSVRACESLISEISVSKSPKRQKDAKQDPFIKNIQEDLIGVLGTKVSIKSGKNKGKIEIEYYGEDELEQIVGIIMGE